MSGEALVLGGSIAGLLATRVLADRFARVTVWERDELPLHPEPRQGTPHARHTHGLLARGLETFEGLFPGISEELMSLGASRGDLVEDCHWHAMGGFHAAAPSGLIALAQSRALLEFVIRRRVIQLPNVVLRDRVAVERPITDEAKARVLGAEAVDRRTGARESLAADLVVDATGRGSRLPQWLEELGYERPPEERIEMDLAYATRYFHRREESVGGRLGMVVTQSPPNKRFAAIIKMENALWTISMGGMLGDHPTLSDEGFIEFAYGLPTPAIYDFLKTAEPASEIISYKYPASIRRHYERLPRFPAGLVPLGDSIASFNPIYGQGMTVAGLEALLLRDCVTSGLPLDGRHYLKRVARLIDTPWQIAAGSDLRNPGVRGPRTLLTRLLNSYLNRLHRAAHHDGHVAIAFHRVANLLASPTTLFRPGIMRRVLW